LAVVVVVELIMLIHLLPTEVTAVLEAAVVVELELAELVALA